MSACGQLFWERTQSWRMFMTKPSLATLMMTKTSRWLGRASCSWRRIGWIKRVMKDIDSSCSISAAVKYDSVLLLSRLFSYNLYDKTICLTPLTFWYRPPSFSALFEEFFRPPFKCYFWIVFSNNFSYNSPAMTAPAPEQLNLKVKSQVLLPLCRTEKRSSSRSRTPPSSRNWWTPTASDKAYRCIDVVKPRQCAIPVRWRETARYANPQGAEHGEWRWDRRGERAGRRKMRQW